LVEAVLIWAAMGRITAPLRRSRRVVPDMFSSETSYQLSAISCQLTQREGFSLFWLKAES
jgi:hypothetical protein